MKRYLLSLVIPTYNCSAFLRDSMDSVLCQLPENCELVVVDDGSDEKTLDCLRSYKGSRDNLKIIFRPHGGVSVTRNAGLETASGEYIAFMDCDDNLKPDFFEKSLKLLDTGADLYIFSFDRIEKDGSALPLTVEDRLFESASDFADEYIRTRHLLIYSASNKFYRKNILNRYDIRFRERLEFGEDRLFNYDYLRHCGSILTSSVKMFNYMQINPESASRRSFPGHYSTLLMLHMAKMDCFLTLSKGTTTAEKRDFIGYDISNEVGHAIERFDVHPNEKEESLPKINHLLFGETADIEGPFDYIIVLGSRDCGYRVKKAFEIAGSDPDTVFVLTGGNMHKDGEKTEADYMADYMREKGVNGKRLLLENEAGNTFHNLELSAGIIEKEMEEKGRTGPVSIGIVTAGFHVPRTRMMTARIPWYGDKETVLIPAYGKHTGPDNWYSDPLGKEIGLREIAKYAMCRFDETDIED